MRKGKVIKRVLMSTPVLHFNYLPWVEAFNSRGVSVSFVTLSESRKFPSSISVNNFEHVDGARNKILYYPGINRVIKLLRKEKPDLVILREFSLTNVILAISFRVLSSGVVLFYDQNPVGFLGKFRILSRIFISSHLMTTVLGSGERKNKIFKTASFVPMFYPAAVTSEEVSRKYHKNPVPLKVVTVGKFRDERKNLRLLVASLSEYLESGCVELTLIGELSSEFEKEYLKLKQLCKSLVLSGASITFKKNISQGEVFRIYNESHVFILPSEREPASISQIEAMAHGLPAILCKDNGTRYVVKNNYNGYLISANEREIKKTIGELIGDKEKLERLSIHALNTISKEFSSHKFLASFSLFMEKCSLYFPAHDVEPRSQLNKKL